MADTLGSNTSIETRAVELDTNSTTTGVTAYAIYHGSDLAKMAVLNLDFWIPSDGQSSRPYKDVEISVPKRVNGSVKVERLGGADSFDQDTVTWAGERWTYAHQGVAERIMNDTQMLQVQDSKISVRINATEAVLVSF